jgi:GT2 family glycosyltransferase
MQRAHGEIVAWLNSDDYYLPGAIRAAVQAFEQNPEAVLVYGNMLAVDANGQIINHLSYRPLTLDDLLCFEIIGQPAVFMRRAAFEQAGGLDPSYHFLLDHHLWIRMALQGSLVHVAQTWAAARYHAAAKNRASAVEFGREAFRILDWAAAQPQLAPLLGRRARASAHRVNARYLLDGGRPWPALAAWLSAFFIHPPVALRRLNILISALLHVTGLRAVHRAYLNRRRSRLSR